MNPLNNIAIEAFLRIKTAFIITLAFTALAGCAASLSTINIRTLKPAAIDLDGIKKVAVVGFEGKGGDAVTGKFTAALVESKRFDVLEREKAARILKEHELYMTGLVDEKTAVKIGHMVGADALIFGTVDAYKVTDELGAVALPKVRKRDYYLETNVDNRKRRVKVSDYEHYSITAPSKTRAGIVSVTFKVVKIETAEVVAAKNVTKTWEGINIADPDARHPDAYPTPKQYSVRLADSATVLNLLAGQAVQDLVNEIAPHYVVEKKDWLTIDDNTRTAEKYMVAGQYKDALAALTPLLESLESRPGKNRDKLHPVYYDTGVVYEVLGDFEKADEFYRKAISLKADENYINALANVRKAKFEEERRKIQELPFGKAP